MDRKNQSLSDRRAAEGDLPDDLLEEQEADFADEHTPSPSDPPVAPADTPGGESEGYSPQTRV